MVSKRRLDYGFNGNRRPIVPRAPRSIRRRGPCKKLVKDSELCAFELLAAVAGKLSQESESSASSNVAEGKSHLVTRDGNENVQPKDDKALKSESFDHGSYAESAFVPVPETSIKEDNLLSNFKCTPQAENDYVVEQTSVHAHYDYVEKMDCDMKLGTSEHKNADEKFICKIGDSICRGDSFDHKVESALEVQSDNGKNQIGYFSMANTSTVNDPICERVNTKVLINSDTSVKLPLYRKSIHDSLLHKSWNNVKLGIRDDDEYSFGCNKSTRPLKPQPRIGRHRMRKMMASKYWKAGPKLKDYELYNTSAGMKSFYRYRKSTYARERCHRDRVPLNKRKLSDNSFDFAFDQLHSSDSISNLPEKGTRGASGASTKDHSKANHPQVKFSIKSFKVPELYIEVPETATVGSLKRTVVDAVTAILGGGLQVGVVFHGKKVRDDHRTLQQTGISQCGNLDNLGFTLEPNFTHVTPPVTPKKPQQSSYDADQTLTRSPASPVIGLEISNASVDPPVFPKLDNVGKNEVMFSPKTPTKASTKGADSDSKALVPVPPMNAEAHSLVPANPKPKRTEVSQRRARRPFSVAEVEALVEAVETLGTGRWRDVKLRAFENADHRTYVDVKDKWKTLVHTASIAPQQRRGEPVPHELLTRVLSAHSYWSQNQPKQHTKILIEPLKIIDSREETVGA